MALNQGGLLHHPIPDGANPIEWNIGKMIPVNPVVHDGSLRITIGLDCGFSFRPGIQDIPAKQEVPILKGAALLLDESSSLLSNRREDLKKLSLHLLRWRAKIGMTRSWLLDFAKKCRLDSGRSPSRALVLLRRGRGHGVPESRPRGKDENHGRHCANDEG